MNKIKFIFLFLIPFVSFSQNDFEYTITVLDPFTTSKIGQEGVIHAGSIEHQGMAHPS